MSYHKNFEKCLIRVFCCFSNCQSSCLLQSRLFVSLKDVDLCNVQNIGIATLKNKVMNIIRAMFLKIMFTIQFQFKQQKVCYIVSCLNFNHLWLPRKAQKIQRLNDQKVFPLETLKNFLISEKAAWTKNKQLNHTRKESRDLRWDCKTVSRGWLVLFCSIKIQKQ